jgi:PhzF family phenazine biosynthesis protein
MKLTLYQVDAFTDKVFGGNPAAVVPLKQWIDDAMMQRLAMENNLSETVFFVESKQPDIDFDIRWFTPVLEINLCGHATLASAFVLFEKLNFSKQQIRFHCKSGLLTVTKNNGMIEMDFPSWKPELVTEDFTALIGALGSPKVTSISRSRDIIVELENEDAVKSCDPDFNALKRIGEKVIITARGNEVDFVSRFFAPVAGIDEDPVTGSAHSQLIPYWSEKLGKIKLHAKQLSQRGGELWCESHGERVKMGGKCVFYMKGEIELN